MYKQQSISGVLNLRIATPIIEALFDSYGLAYTIPGKVTAYFTDQVEATAAKWDEIRKGFHQWAKFHLKEIPLDADQLTVKQWLYLAGAHFKLSDSSFFKMIEWINEKTAPHFYTLFDIATYLDDGHGLISLFIGRSFSKAGSIHEYGGSALFVSKEYRYDFHTDSHEVLCKDICHELMNDHLDKAAYQLKVLFHSFLNGVRDTDKRQKVCDMVIDDFYGAEH